MLRHLYDVFCPGEDLTEMMGTPAENRAGLHETLMLHVPPDGDLTWDVVEQCAANICFHCPAPSQPIEMTNIVRTRPRIGATATQAGTTPEQRAAVTARI